jgi:threonine/homoserine/homoserine lactone efflux protein
VTLSTFAAFLAAAFVIIVVPGPTNLAIVSDSIEAGAKRSFWTVTGAAFSHAAFIILATAGVGAVISLYPNLLVYIKWFGVLYLAVQGVRLIFKRSVDLETRNAAPQMRGITAYILKGFIVNSTNPKALLFYAALFPPFVNPHAAFLPQLLILASTFLCLFFVIGLLHAIIAHKARAFFGNSKRMNLGNKISGTVMVGAAVWMATK